MVPMAVTRTAALVLVHRERAAATTLHPHMERPRTAGATPTPDRLHHLVVILTADMHTADTRTRPPAMAMPVMVLPAAPELRRLTGMGATVGPGLGIPAAATPQQAVVECRQAARMRMLASPRRHGETPSA